MAKSKDVIEFKTVPKAKEFVKKLKELHSKYSRTTYYRKGKKVYRY